MTQQTTGETLFKGIAGGSPSAYVYTPWLGAGGDTAVYGVQINNISASCTLSWNVETKNSEETDASATALMASDQAETTVGVKYSKDGGGSTAALDGCKQLYRYRFATGSGYSVTEWVNFRELAPAWQRTGSR